MQNDTNDTYETPALCELGKAEELTKGLDDGHMADFRGGFRIQHAIVPVEE